MPTDLSHPLSIAKQLAQTAGAIIRQELVLGANKEWKSDHTPVTMVDKKINQLVIDTIHQEFPEHSILAEEGSDLTRSKEFVWICDPIDGTFPFMHGIPTSTFVLALVHDGQPILGVVYDPFMDRLFTATKGNGTMLNGTPIHTKLTTSILDESVGVVPWKGDMDIFTPLMAKLADSRAKLFSLLSIVYMDTMVACGEFAATIFPGASAHDSAASKIIIEEAGGVFTSLTGEVDRYDRPVHGHLACANKEIHSQIVTLLH
jgi:fructose-1,6-bisphosphatase/inositol monophosphatase family enzyme